MHRWDAQQALDLIEQEQVSAIAGVPATLFELLDRPRARAELEQPRQHRLRRHARSAGAGPPHRRPAAARAAPGNGYGLTETTGAASPTAARTTWPGRRASGADLAR